MPSGSAPRWVSFDVFYDSTSFHKHRVFPCLISPSFNISFSSLVLLSFRYESLSAAQLACTSAYTLVHDCRSWHWTLLIMYLNIIAFLALPLVLSPVLCSQFPDGQVQPGCYPPPALPQNFSTGPDLWRSATSWTGSKSRLRSRQSARVWDGWSCIKYLFTLFVMRLRSWDCPANVW